MLCQGRQHHGLPHARFPGHLQEVLHCRQSGGKEPGHPLARIDDRDFSTALDQAKADVAAAEATVNAKQASLDIQQSTIAAARATLDVDRANETRGKNNKRYTNLATNGYAPVQTAQQAASAIAAAQATIARDSAALDASTKQVELRNAELAPARATLAHDQAVMHQAELNLCYAMIVAPVDGTVGNRTLRVGQYVQAGTQLMAVVPTTAAYIVANYKETQLTDVHAGQPVALSRSTCSRAAPIAAMSTAWRRQAARNLRCCRPTTPPATSPRLFSASR